MNFYDGKKAIVINIDHIVRYSKSGAPYIIDANDIAICPGVIPLLRRLKDQGYHTVGVSHQPGIRTYGVCVEAFLHGVARKIGRASCRERV